MGARGGGGSRGGGGAGGARYTYLQESEKAVKVNVSITAEYYSPYGSSFGGENVKKQITTTAWLPKSQMTGGKPSEWIMKQKAKDVASFNAPRNQRVYSASYKYTDAKGKVIEAAK